MKVRCEIVMEYEDEESARAILEAVRADNDGYVDYELKASRVIFRAESENPMSLSHTVNDLLACVKAAENSLLD